MPGLVRAIDVSSAQPQDLAGIIAAYKPAHVIVKLYLPWENIPQSYSRAQIASARAAGCSVGGYVWCYRSADPAQTVNAALDLAGSVGMGLDVLWLDCETYEEGGRVIDDGPDANWLEGAFAACRARGIQPGVYSGAWWLPGYLGDLSVLAGIPLWLAEYNGIADLDSVDLMRPLQREQLYGHQYAADGIDLDVFDARAV